MESFGPINTDGLDLNGYVKTEAKLILFGEPAFLETKYNLRWATGNKVEVKVRNSQGIWVLHRTLRILTQWFNGDIGDPILELDIGCKFALRETRPPSPGDLKIPILEPAEISDKWLVKIVGNTRIYLSNVPVWRTVNYWLVTFGFSEIFFPPGGYRPSERISWTEQYRANSSIMEFIGQIWYKNTRCVLYIDELERIQSRHIDLSPTVIDFTFDARDLEPYPRKSTGERETVAGIIRCLGVTDQVWPYIDPPSATTSTTNGDFQASETITVSTTATSTIVTKRGTAVISGLGSGNDDLGRIGRYEEITTETFDGALPEQLNPNPLFPPIPALPNYLMSKTYLLREQRAISGSSNLTPLATTKASDIRYKYRNTSAIVSGNYVRGVEITKEVEVVKTLPEGETNLKTDQVKDTNWVFLDEGIYQTTTTILRPGDTENRRHVSVSSSVGESQPPGITWQPRSQVIKSVEVFGQAKFSYPPGAPTNEHYRDFPLGGFCDNSGFAKLMAEQIGALIIGRHEAITTGLRPTDDWLAHPIPFPSLAINWPDGKQDVYLGDLGTTVFEDISYLGVKGIWLGRRNPATGVITPPYAIRATGVGYGNVGIGYGKALLGVG